MKIAPGPIKRRTRSEEVLDPPKVDIKCAECGGPMRLLRALDIETNEVRWLFWACMRHPACYCTHSAHPDGTPMGKPANRQTRAARHSAHRIFDRLWKISGGDAGYMKRSEAYRWLAEQFFTTEEVHIGNMTLEECERVQQLAAKKLDQLQAKHRLENKRHERNRKRNRAHGLRNSARHKIARDRAQRFDSDPPQAPDPEPEEEPPRKGRKPGRATIRARLVRGRRI